MYVMYHWKDSRKKINCYTKYDEIILVRLQDYNYLITWKLLTEYHVFKDGF